MLSLESYTRDFELYTLDAVERPVRCTNPLEWLDWMRTHPRVLEANLLLNNREIVTLFAGYAGELRNGTALTYCTLMKPEPQMPTFAVTLQWYANRTEAEAGHAVILSRFKNQIA